MDKHTLQQYRSIRREIAHLEEEKQRVLDRLLAPAAPDGMPHARGNQDSIGQAIARRDRYQRLIDNKLDELIALREEIERAIEGLPSQDRELIRLRYIEGFRWEEIAVKLHYSIQHIYHRHGHILLKMRVNKS